MHRRRSWYLVFLVYTLLGAVLAVGVAVWSANPSADFDTFDPTREGFVIVDRTCGIDIFDPTFDKPIERRTWTRQTRDGGIHAGIMHERTVSRLTLQTYAFDDDAPPIARLAAELGESGLPGWAVHLERFRELTKGTTLKVTAYGWPLRCFASAEASADEPNGPNWHRQGSRCMIRYKAWSGLAAVWHSQDGSILVPYKPLWGGLAANSLLFGAAWATVLRLGWGTATGLRVRRRRRRGFCTQCGYDLRGGFAGGCPECGWNRPCATAQSPSGSSPNGTTQSA